MFRILTLLFASEIMLSGCASILLMQPIGNDYTLRPNEGIIVARGCGKQSFPCVDDGRANQPP